MILDAHIENGNLKLRGSSGSSWLISASVFAEGESDWGIFVLHIRINLCHILSKSSGY